MKNFLTLPCRYCRGKKKLDCPLCSVDDVYELSYGAREVAGSENDESTNEEVSGATPEESSNDSH